jgi:hypothetical protein
MRLHAREDADAVEAKAIRRSRAKIDRCGGVENTGAAVGTERGTSIGSGVTASAANVSTIGHRRGGNGTPVASERKHQDEPGQGREAAHEARAYRQKPLVIGT